MTICPKKILPLSLQDDSPRPIIVKESRDKQGRVISIWKTSSVHILGSVLFPNGKVVIIPHSRIILPTGGILSEEVLDRIDINRLWHFIYDDTANKISIWPHLIAGARDDINGV